MNATYLSHVTQEYNKNKGIIEYESLERELKSKNSKWGDMEVKYELEDLQVSKVIDDYIERHLSRSHNMEKFLWYIFHIEWKKTDFSSVNSLLALEEDRNSVFLKDDSFLYLKQVITFENISKHLENRENLLIHVLKHHSRYTFNSSFYVSNTDGKLIFPLTKKEGNKKYFHVTPTLFCHNLIMSYFMNTTKFHDTPGVVYQTFNIKKNGLWVPPNRKSSLVNDQSVILIPTPISYTTLQSATFWNIANTKEYMNNLFYKKFGFRSQLEKNTKVCTLFSTPEREWYDITFEDILCHFGEGMIHTFYPSFPHNPNVTLYKLLKMIHDDVDWIPQYF